jgi:hypothetical protein
MPPAPRLPVILNRPSVFPIISIGFILRPLLKAVQGKHRPYSAKGAQEKLGIKSCDSRQGKEMLQAFNNLIKKYGN